MAWDLPGTPPAVTAVDVARYTALLLRATGTILAPLGIEEAEIWRQVHGWGRQVPWQLPLPGLADQDGPQGQSAEPVLVQPNSQNRNCQHAPEALCYGRSWLD